MSHARDMIDAAPYPIEFDADELAAAIDAAGDCSQTCTACAASDLAEDDVKDMRRCISLCSDCADVCTTTARVLSRDTRYDPLLVQRQLQACVRACASCAEECAKHAQHHHHCAICEETCRTCEAACKKLLDAEALDELKALAGG